MISASVKRINKEDLMKTLHTLLLILSFTFVASASAEDHREWLQDGAPAANSDARKTIDGFGASVIVTADPDWESKWATPSEVVPTFSTVQSLKRGEKATVLIFFANPAVTVAGMVDVTFDLKITGPDKKVEENRGLKAFSGTLDGPPTNIYLAENVIHFIGEPADPLGEWVVDVVVHDNHRHVSIPLRAKFILTLTGDELNANRVKRGQVTS
jgi:hypothetical protein